MARLIILFFVIIQVAWCSSKCADGWQYSENSGNCYRFFEEDSTWSMSEIMCAIRGSHHIAIHDLTENRFLQQIAAAAGHKTLWLGAAQFGSSEDYVWSDHSPFDFEHWQEDKRPAYNHARRCTKMDVPSGKWYQSCCKVPSPFICVKKASAVGDDKELQGL
uniref:C-type lectin domain-containing protein n=1 Tax=Parascaris univalens TaxID=6257 RepID=A0A915CDN1_PARUN